MKTRDLYAKYDIMPQLATHQLRVAGIGKLITDSWDDRELADKCVKSCLVHDMGNIVKFHGLTDPVWKQIQDKYRGMYGHEAHDATKGILFDAGLIEYADFIEEEKRLYESTPTKDKDFDSYSKPSTIVLYADLRVAPSGVVSMKERTDDLLARYKNKRTEMIYGPATETYVQSMTTVDIASIKEQDVVPLFSALLDFEI